MITQFFIVVICLFSFTTSTKGQAIECEVLCGKTYPVMCAAGSGCETCSCEEGCVTDCCSNFVSECSSFDYAIPVEWTCGSGMWGDGNCDCGCGAEDPDCTPVECFEARQGWTCDISWWIDGVCDCQCGTRDWACDSEICVPPPEWTCAADWWKDWYCDCGCGVLSEPDDCTYGECVPDDWECSESDYGNYICDCHCGADDVDCKDLPADCTPPGNWTCPDTWYRDGECDCQCNGDDIDCSINGQSCETPPDYRCSPTTIGDYICDCDCNYDYIDCDLTECSPEGWTCTSPQWEDLYCDCHCGIPDPNCGPTECASPPEWICSDTWYNDKTRCDCHCGAPDPDCEYLGKNCSVPEGFLCQDSYWGDRQCDCACGIWDEVDCTLTQCVPPTWTCPQSQYGDGRCDCYCGAVDVECAVGECDVPGNWTCDPLQWGDYFCQCSCGAIDMDCAYEERSCDIPLEWTCDDIMFGDGTCDCNCGSLDIDCYEIADCYPSSCELLTPQIFTMPVGALTDGSDPRYKNNLYCRWELNLDPSFNTILLERSVFGVSSTGSDLVTFTAGDVVRKYSGSVSQFPYLLAFPGNTLIVEFSSDYKTTSFGFFLLYRGLEEQFCSSDPIANCESATSVQCDRCVDSLPCSCVSTCVEEENCCPDYDTTCNPAVPPSYCEPYTFVSASNGTISDGSQQENYLNNYQCKWQIQPTGTSNDYGIILTFNYLELEEGYDFVYITGTRDFYKELTGSFEGEILVPGNYATVVFSSDYSKTDSGFELDYKLQQLFCYLDQCGLNNIPCDDCIDSVCSCQDICILYGNCCPDYSVCSDTSGVEGYCGGQARILTIDESVISDGSGSNNYLDDSTCEWKITVSGTAIRIEFINFDLEEGYDFLTITNLENEEETVLTGSQLPSAIVVPHNSILITFTSDYSNNQNGWALHYTSIGLYCYETDCTGTNIDCPTCGQVCSCATSCEDIGNCCPDYLAFCKEDISYCNAETCGKTRIPCPTCTFEECSCAPGCEDGTTSNNLPCCSDYIDQCEQLTYCLGRCDSILAYPCSDCATGECYCDSSCLAFDDCCDDREVCDIQPTPTSCDNACGKTFQECSCAPECKFMNNCCSDYSELCAQISNILGECDTCDAPASCSVIYHHDTYFCQCPEGQIAFEGSCVTSPCAADVCNSNTTNQVCYPVSDIAYTCECANGYIELPDGSCLLPLYCSGNCGIGGIECADCDEGMCSCDPLCSNFGDCCPGFSALCSGEQYCYGRCESTLSIPCSGEGCLFPTCSCQANCIQSGTCCPDYTYVCPSIGSTCSGSCGEKLDSCSCELNCEETETGCCSDYELFCREDTFCVGNCGKKNIPFEETTCSCDSSCVISGTCCSDYSIVCSINSDPLVGYACDPERTQNSFLCPLISECVEAVEDSGITMCLCPNDYYSTGDDCLPDPCSLGSVSCSENEVCKHLGNGEAECVCATGFRKDRVGVCQSVQYCKGICGEQMIECPECSDGLCYCDFDCEIFEDCCPDFNSECSLGNNGFCDQSCGENGINSPFSASQFGSCGCDGYCDEWGDCCPGFNGVCLSTERIAPIIECFDIFEGNYYAYFGYQVQNKHFNNDLRNNFFVDDVQVTDSIEFKFENINDVGRHYFFNYVQFTNEIRWELDGFNTSLNILESDYFCGRSLGFSVITSPFGKLTTDLQSPLKVQFSTLFGIGQRRFLLNVKDVPSTKRQADEPSKVSVNILISPLASDLQSRIISNNFNSTAIKIIFLDVFDNIEIYDIFPTGYTPKDFTNNYIASPIINGVGSLPSESTVLSEISVNIDHSYFKSDRHNSFVVQAEMNDYFIQSSCRSEGQTNFEPCATWTTKFTDYSDLVLSQSTEEREGFISPVSNVSCLDQTLQISIPSTESEHNWERRSYVAKVENPTTCNSVLISIKTAERVSLIFSAGGYHKKDISFTSKWSPPPSIFGAELCCDEIRRNNANWDGIIDLTIFYNAEIDNFFEISVHNDGRKPIDKFFNELSTTLVCGTESYEVTPIGVNTEPLLTSEINSFLMGINVELLEFFSQLSSEDGPLSFVIPNTYPIDDNECTLTYYNLVDNDNSLVVNSHAIDNQIIQNCVYSEMVELSDTFRSLIEFTQTDPLKFEARLLKSQSITSSINWIACEELALSLLTTNVSTETIENYIGCTLESSSPLYDSDPCCNMEITDQCCVPVNTTVEVTHIVADSEKTDECEVPDCAYMHVSSFGTSLETLDTEIAQCLSDWDKFSSVSQLESIRSTWESTKYYCLANIYSLPSYPGSGWKKAGARCLGRGSCYIPCTSSSICYSGECTDGVCVPIGVSDDSSDITAFITCLEQRNSEVYLSLVDAADGADVSTKIFESNCDEGDCIVESINYCNWMACNDRESDCTREICESETDNYCRGCGNTHCTNLDTPGFCHVTNVGFNTYCDGELSCSIKIPEEDCDVTTLFGVRSDTASAIWYERTFYTEPTCTSHCTDQIGTITTETDLDSCQSNFFCYQDDIILEGIDTESECLDIGTCSIPSGCIFTTENCNGVLLSTGCFVSDEDECIANSAPVITFETEADCLSLMICSDRSEKNEAECVACKERMIPYLSFEKNGVYLPNMWITAEWVQKEVITTPGYRQLDDYAVLSMWNRQRLPVAQTMINCAYGSTLDSLILISCACGAEICDSTINPDLTIPPTISSEVFRICLGQNAVINGKATLVISTDFILAEGVNIDNPCFSLFEKYVPIDNFDTETVGTLSSVSIQSPQQNANKPIYVKSPNGLVVGKIVQDGVGYRSPYQFEGVSICFTVPEVDSTEIVTIGYSSGDLTNITLLTNDLIWISDNGVCTNMTGDGNIYFVAAVDSDWENKTFIGLWNIGDVILMFMAVVIDIAILAYTIEQFIAHINNQKENQAFWDSPKLALFGLMIFLTDRILYFIILPFGGFEQATVLEAIMADLPAVVYFFVYTVIVVRWAEIYHFSTKLKGKKDALVPVMVGINAFIIIAFIGFLVAYFLSQEERVTCGGELVISAASTISLVYKLVFAVFCALAIIGFTFYGTMLMKILVNSASQVANRKSRMTRVYQIGILTLISSLGLLAQAIFRVVSTFISADDRIGLTTFIIIFVIITEGIPALTVIWIFHKRFENVGKDSNTRNTKSKNSKNTVEMKSQ